MNPLYWPRYLRTRRAIVNYPIYDVPHKRAEGTLPKTLIDDNFAYFIDVRLQRLAFFQNWLSERYGVKAPLNEDGILTLEKWGKVYGGGLIPDLEESAEVFSTYQPSWTGERSGYNVLVDVVIFAGEFLISKRPNLHWKLLTSPGGRLDDRDEPMASTLGRPELGGFHLERWTPYLFQTVYFVAIAWNNKLAVGKPRWEVNASLGALCSTILNVAERRDSRPATTSGD